MNALLWILIIMGALHLLALVWVHYGAKPLPERTPFARAVDMSYTIGMGVWAMWLLATRGA